MSETAVQIVPEALPGRVIVEYAKPKEQVGSIFVPTMAQKIDKNVATVVKVGDGTDRAEEMFAKLIRPGTKVIAHPYLGEEFEVGEREEKRKFHIFRMFEVIGYLPVGAE